MGFEIMTPTLSVVTDNISKEAGSVLARSDSTIAGQPTKDTPVTLPEPGTLFIQGVTRDGKPFRPSDWAERLAGAMSSFRPGGAVQGRAAHIGYSPFCVPRIIGGVKYVIVNEALRDIEPMAWDFVMNFARDNALKVAEGQLLPDGTFEATPKAG